MNKFLAVFTALRHGSSLTDPAVHKNRQNLINALIGLLGALAVFLPMEVSADDVANIAGGIASVWGLFNIYYTTATTDKIGMLPSNGNNVQDVSSRDGSMSDSP